MPVTDARPGASSQRLSVGPPLRAALVGSAAAARRHPGAARTWNPTIKLHPVKTRIVYCKDANRHGSYEQFNFLGYAFRQRLCKSRQGKYFAGFTPAVSDDNLKAIGQKIRQWRLHLRSDAALTELARSINPVVQGWITYYGAFHPSRLDQPLERINAYLARWACQKYKRLKRHPRRANRLLANVARRYPNLFAHWAFGLRPAGWTAGAR